MERPTGSLQVERKKSVYVVLLAGVGGCDVDVQRFRVGISGFTAGVGVGVSVGISVC